MKITVKNNSYLYPEESSSKPLKTFCGIASFVDTFTILLLFGKTSYAEDGSLTSVLSMDGFRGALSTIDNSSLLSWVAPVLNFIISAFSLIGLFILIYQIMVSLLYLAGRNTFDMIHEIKSSNQVSGNDVKSLASSFLKSTTVGFTSSISKGGADSILAFFLGIFPDVKQYSDFNGNSKEKYDDDTTVTNYMLKKSLPTIMCIFFFALGFNGTLTQLYGELVDCMTVFADKVVEQNISQYAKQMIETSAKYKFHYSDTQTNMGDLEQNVATDIYAKCAKKLTTSTADSRTALGSNIGAIVNAIFSDSDELKKAVTYIKNNTTFDPTNDSDYKNIEYEVYISTTKPTGTSAKSTYNESTGKFTFDIGTADANHEQKGISISGTNVALRLDNMYIVPLHIVMGNATFGTAFVESGDTKKYYPEYIVISFKKKAGAVSFSQFSGGDNIDLKDDK